MKLKNLHEQLLRLAGQIEDAFRMHDAVHRQALIRLYLQEAAMCGARFTNAENEARTRAELDALAVAAGLPG